MSRSCVGLCAVLVTSFLSSCLIAADDTKTYTDPKEVPPSYALQGEYVGMVNVEDKDFKYGVQVIALGNDKYQAVSYRGGLPGDGAMPDEDSQRYDGTLVDGAVVFESDEFIAKLKNGTLELRSRDGDPIAMFEKVTRKSPTLGAKPPEDAIVLFDGKSADHFEKGEIVQENLLLANTFTKKKFGDHQLHLEFRTPFKPEARGQARGNSGVYVQSRYEIQVLDSFGLSGESNECGGIYKVSKPKFNMCFPPLTWQTYDIDFVAAKYDSDGKKTDNARVTVRHNGVIIHENLELPESTPGRHKEGPGPDALYLQGHGNPVVYRNIWVVEK